jgi:Kef-type K+ transport system membrane component KefB/Trk K+ transport system NAD-binding subunit
MTDTVTLHAIAPIVLILFLGLLVATVSRRVGLSPIVGYIGLGVALQAFRLEKMFDASVIHLLSELGVMFLLFDLGLRFSPERVRRNAANIFGLGPLQVVAAALVFFAVSLLLGLTQSQALLIGLTLSLSSTVAVERLITERHQVNCPVGLAASSVLVFQDLAGMFLLIVVQGMQAGAPLLTVAGQTTAKALLAFSLALLAARCLVRPVLGYIARHNNEEAFTTTALLFALAAGWMTGLGGLSLSLGAFLGGVALADSPYRPVIAAEIRPFRGLLLGFFLVSTGLSLNVQMLGDSFWTIVLATLAMLAAKTLANILASRLFAWSVAGSTQLGFLLGQGSEFALVILAVPLVRDTIGEDKVSLLIVVVSLTIAAAPNFAELGRFLAGRLRMRATLAEHAELKPLVRAAPVVIVGMGSVGRGVADALRTFHIQYFAMERDPQRLRLALADGYEVFYGDGFDVRLWESIDLHERKLSVLTAPDYAVLVQTASLIRQKYPALKRFAVVNNDREANLFRSLGLVPLLDQDAVPGLDVAVVLLKELGVPHAAVTAWVATQRRIKPKVLEPAEVV